MNDLIGKTIVEIHGYLGDDRLQFSCSDGSTLTFFHEQNCCESVEIEDVTGDMADLMDSPIILAEESAADYKSTVGGNDGTWTFYRFGTIKGYVTIRWLGTSNGYYSERVNYEWDKK